MSSSTQAGGVVVFTQVYPNPPTQCSPQQVCVGTQSFVRAHPLAVGTVQILIGLMVFLFGIVMTIDADTLGVYSGAFVWGSMFYIVSGSLTVAAGKSLSRCLVNTSLGFNVVASVASLTAMILYSFDTAGLIRYCYDDQEWPFYCYQFRERTMGISGVLAVFHLLEFIVSIVVASFACKATCNCGDQQPQVFVVPANAQVMAQAPPTSQVPPVSVTMAPPLPQMVVSPKPEGLMNPGFEPPAYTQS